MSGLMQQALGADWERLPPALQAHYRDGTTLETGHLAIEYPRAMQPLLSVLRRLGALVDRPGHRVATRVEKQVVGDRQHWRRTLRYEDGQVLRFDTVWEAAAGGHVIEFVNPILGLEMAPSVVGRQLHYRGVRFLLKLGRLRLPIPQSLALGTTTIVEEAVDERHFTMDFRMTHPLLGQVFRYAGRFEVDAKG